MEDIVVIGAGAAGLAAAHHLRAQGHDPLMVDAGPGPGGVVRSLRLDGYLLEAGPHATWRDHPAVARFLADTADAPDDAATAATAGGLVPVSPHARDRYVLHDGRPVALPRSPVGLVRTPLLSARGKLRLLREPWVAPAAPPDETVLGFLTRRLGPEVAPLVDAMVTGIHAGDPARLSAPATLPTLVRWEAAHGGLLRGARKARRGRTPRGPLAAPADGMQAFVSRGARRLRAAYATRVTGLRPHEDGRLVITLEDDGGTRRTEARRVIIALPPGPTAQILDVEDPKVPRAPVAVVGLGYRTADLPDDAFEGYGVLHPDREDRYALGVLFESSLFPDRAPEGHVLVRALVGGRRRPERVHDDDAHLVQGVRDDLAKTQDIDAAPVWSHVVRHRPGIPQMELGHVRRLAPLRAALSQFDKVATCGWGWDSVGLADGLARGQAAARSVLGVHRP